jgi:iron complex transport system substrate-binding protein
VVVGARTSAGWGAYVEGSSRINFMRRLGFVNSPAVQALAVPVSPERLDLYDADLTVVFPIEVSPETITGDPLFRTVPSVAAGRLVVPDKSVAPAPASATAPGLSYALDVTVPLFAAALQR